MAAESSGFWSNPWLVGTGVTIIGGLVVWLVTGGWRRAQPAAEAPRIESPSGGKNIFNTGAIQQLHPGDVHQTQQVPSDAALNARIGYASRRMLERIRDAARSVTAGSQGSELQESRLDEVEAAVRDFDQVASDLHLITDAELRNRISTFSVRVRREVALVRANNEKVREYWDKAKGEYTSGRYSLDDWLMRRKPLHTQHTTNVHMESHHMVRSWVDEAEVMIASLRPEKGTE